MRWNAFSFSFPVDSRWDIDLKPLVLLWQQLIWYTCKGIGHSSILEKKIVFLLSLFFSLPLSLFLSLSLSPTLIRILYSFFISNLIRLQGRVWNCTSNSCSYVTWGCDDYSERNRAPRSSPNCRKGGKSEIERQTERVDLYSITFQFNSFHDDKWIAVPAPSIWSHFSVSSEHSSSEPSQTHRRGFHVSSWSLLYMPSTRGWLSTQKQRYSER